MSGERVAIRYARAFVEVLRDKNALGDADSFLAFCSLVDENKELKALFANVTVTKAHKAAVAKALAAKLGYSTWLTNFLVVLAGAGRLNILSDVSAAVSARLDELRNIRSVMVTTTVALNEVDLAQFKEMMKKKLGSDIRITNQVDAAILGGAVTQVGSVVYDGSVRAQLNKLRAELVKEN